MRDPMPNIPLIDAIGNLLLASLFVVLLWLQWGFPLRRQHFGMLQRLGRNFVLSIPGFAVVRLAMLPIPIAIAIWARQQHVGLLNWIDLPTWAVVIATFLLMDYAYWWWHWAMHMVPFFWRFHNVHHTDLDLDVSTAARFHFGEMILSTGLHGIDLVEHLFDRIVSVSAKLATLQPKRRLADDRVVAVENADSAWAVYELASGVVISHEMSMIEAQGCESRTSA